MFNSPLNFCTVCRQYVALDQSQHECAREHACPQQLPCPLSHLFSIRDSGAVPEHAAGAPASTTQTATPASKR